MTQSDTTPLHLRAEIAGIYSPATRDALSIFPPAPRAQEGCVVMTSRTFRVDNKPSSIPEGLGTEIWQIHKDRLMPVSLVSLQPEERARMALPYAMTAEDRVALGPVLRAMQGIDLKEHNLINLMLLPGAAIVVKWTPDLALGKREGADAQAHIDTNIFAFIDETLSNHERLTVVTNLEWVLNDLVTWGTYGRHLGDSDGAAPGHHNIRVSF